MRETLTRRGFMKGAGAAAGAAVVAGIPVAAAKTAAAKTPASLSPELDAVQLDAAQLAANPPMWMSAEAPEIEVQIGPYRVMVPVRYDFIEVDGKKTVLRQSVTQVPLVAEALRRKK